MLTYSFNCLVFDSIPIKGFNINGNLVKDIKAVLVLVTFH